MELPENQASQDQVESSASGKNRSLEYFTLVVGLTIPFWLFGGNPLPVPVKLPVSALSLVIPMLAACILTYRRCGFTGIKALFKRVLDYRNIKKQGLVLARSDLISFDFGPVLCSDATGGAPSPRSADRVVDGAGLPVGVLYRRYRRRAGVDGVCL